MFASLCMLACCYGHYDIGAGKKINKDMWTGSWIVVQTSFRPTSSCLCASFLRANVFGGVLDTRQFKGQYGGSCGRFRS